MKTDKTKHIEEAATIYLFVIGNLEDFNIEGVHRKYENAEKELSDYFNDTEIQNHLEYDEEMGILEINPESKEKIKLLKRCSNHCLRDEEKARTGYDIQQLCKDCGNSWICSCSCY